MLLLNGFERSHRLSHEMVKDEPSDGAEDDDKGQMDTQLNELGLLPPLDGGDDRRSAFLFLARRGGGTHGIDAAINALIHEYFVLGLHGT